MITHNMTSALQQGNRTLMMEGGRIILDISGSKRDGMVVDDLLEMFKTESGHKLDNDRILLAR